MQRFSHYSAISICSIWQLFLIVSGSDNTYLCPNGGVQDEKLFLAPSTKQNLDYDIVLLSYWKRHMTKLTNHVALLEKKASFTKKQFSSRYSAACSHFSGSSEVWLQRDINKSLVYNRQENMVAEPTANISGTLCLYHYVLATPCPPVIGGGNLGCGFHYSEQFNTCISPCDAHDPDEFLGSQITCSTYLSSDADLPRIHSAAENEYIFSIAMSKGITGSVWLGKDSSSRSWVDGSPMNYTNFAPGVEWNDDEDYCLAMEMSGGNAGFWRFYSCLDDGYTICQAPTNTE